ncbi:MAG: VacJ family lipoprotein [Gammaproteobacteria bacterium]|nr:VacJ family lipoprotein [Gammaproteobacteria bacterium]
MSTSRLGFNMMSAAIGACFLALGGCASAGKSVETPDPWEGMNRKFYSFNKGIDSVVLKPVAKAYDAVTPTPVQDGVGNVFRNIGEISNFLNNVLQFKLGEAGVDTGRFFINSTIGIGGLFDVASGVGLQRNEEDFGQTLAHWGVDSGPFLMLPLLGPSTLRDGLAKPVDSALDPVQGIEHVPTRNRLLVTRLISGRVELFPVEKQLEDALDEYAFLRDAYLQRREFLIKDGEVPPKTESACDPEADADCEPSW